MMRVLACVLLLAGPATAQTFEFPGQATATVTAVPTRGSYALPVGPWTATGLPVEVINGMIERAVWQIDAPGLGSLDLIQPLRAQLVANGFDPVFECETAGCGGFDFRFALDVVAEPDMHVDLGDFRFLAARKGDEAIGLLVSRSVTKGFVQMIRAVVQAPPQLPNATNLAFDRPETLIPPKNTMDALENRGAVVLEGLDFGTGAADLTEGRYDSLAELAAWLADNPGRRVALVGHTDAVGGLDGNLVVSRRRAQSVRARLIEAYGVPPEQLDAQGVGYLAPLTSNLTEDGRQQNRRVEVILTSPE
jgi:outer membrane protein OmpA-like peptidoglycan-associated protein